MRASSDGTSGCSSVARRLSVSRAALLSLDTDWAPGSLPLTAGPSDSLLSLALLFGWLIHTSPGASGGVGLPATKRSGWSAYASSSTCCRCCRAVSV